MTPQRAKDLMRLHRYLNGGCGAVGAQCPDIPLESDSEHRALRQLLAASSGDSCMSTILQRIANGKILLVGDVPPVIEDAQKLLKDLQWGG